MKCECCKNDEGTEELHPCPFDEEINDDPSERCNCCEECEHNCAMEI